VSFLPAAPTAPDPDAVQPYGLQNIRVVVNKVARALYGATYVAEDTGMDSEQLTADQLKDVTADAIAKVMFFSNGLWPYTLQVDERDTAGVPQEFSIQPTALPLPDETVIVCQAALDFFFHQFLNKKVSEEISDVAGQKWAYAISANVLLAQINGLRADRDRALETLVQRADYLVDYVSFIAERDALTSAMVEWWVRPGLTMPSGQEMFPGMGSFGP
jgi:hypothetical protein